MLGLLEQGDSLCAPAQASMKYFLGLKHSLYCAILHAFQSEKPACLLRFRLFDGRCGRGFCEHIQDLGAEGQHPVVAADPQVQQHLSHLLRNLVSEKELHS